MKVNINKNSELIVSIAEKRGSTGVIVQNYLYAQHNLNIIYKPCDIDKNSNMSELISSLRLLKIKGAAISMPFKEAVIDYIDNLSEIAKECNSVNTLINKSGTITGHNTDYLGAYQVMSKYTIKKALIYGSGGVSKSIIYALKKLGCQEYTVVARNKNKKDELEMWIQEKLKLKVTSDMSSYDIIINCTPVGMSGEESLVSEKLISNSRIIFDLVTNNTNLLKKSKKMGKIVLYGRDMSIWQSLYQFAIYTGIEVNYEKEFKRIKKLFKE